jgi:PDZ domain
VRVSAKFCGCNGWQAAFEKYTQCKWEPLETNGNLEEELLERISSNLPALSQAELYPTAKPDSAVTSLAREQVVLFEKIVAAFQLNAPTDRIMAELVDAKASLQTFTDSQQSLALPRFSAALNKAAQQFATALNANPNDRPAVLKAAMDSFADAKRCFSNYQKFVQEVEPNNVAGLPSASVRVIQPASYVSTQNVTVSTSPVLSDGAALSHMLGIQAVACQEEGAGAGAQITEVASGSAADSAGLRSEYVIQSLDGKPVRNPTDLAAELVKHSPGSTVKLGLVFRTSAMGWLPKTTVVTLQQNR